MTKPSVLRRPRLLIRAARAGLNGYERDTHLGQLAPGADAKHDRARVLDTLRQMEESCEAARRERATAYSPGWHVSLLTALLAETRAQATA